MALRFWRVRPTVQHYQWGARGGSSLVRTFAEANSLRFLEDPSLCFAELWYGAHPSSPSFVPELSASLAEAIATDPVRTLGPGAERSGNELPFLAKILSIRTPLSIQIHPSKEQAERLHRADPEHYPDANHKPEVAYTLTELTLLSGFRPLAEIRAEVSRFTELYSLLGEPQNWPEGDDATIIRSLYSQILNSEGISAIVDAVVDRIRSQSDLSTNQKELLHAAEYFPSDRGLLSFLFLNVISVPPGTMLFTPAGIPHSYLRGEIFECMAASDNVIRVGLTPKFQDRTALLECADFHPRNPQIVAPNVVRAGTSRYDVPVSEFALVRQTLDSEHPPLSGVVSSAEMWIVTKGSITLACQNAAPETLSAGACIYLPYQQSDFDIQSQAAELIRIAIPR